MDYDAIVAAARALDLPDPEGLARSQSEEGIPQLHRYALLRQAWRRVVADGSTAWIDAQIGHFERSPDAPYAGVGRALKRLRQLGASEADLTAVVRGMQAELMFALFYLLDDPSLEEPAGAAIAWALVAVSEDGQVLGPMSGLHEDVLGTDPTGREMRPDPTAT
jgi:hypothetical protein